MRQRHLSNGKFNPENEKKMKTINYFSIAFAGLAMFCACTKAEIGDNAPVNGGDKVELVAGEGQIVCTTPPMTKTATGAQNSDGSYPVVWLDKDQVKVYGESSLDGVVHTASVTEASTSAIFYAPSKEESVTDETRYAVYPAAMAGSMTADGITVDLTGLRRQMYHSNIPNFGRYENYSSQVPEGYEPKDFYEASTVFPHLPLWAKAENGRSDFTFSNLMGVVKLALNDYQGNGLLIKSVKMTAKSPISGTMTVAADGSITMAGEGADANTVTIFSESGVKISDSTPHLGDAGVAFFFFIPVGTYEGFDFEFTTTDGRIFRKSTANTVNVEAGLVKKFPVLNFTLFYGSANCYQIANASSADIDITPRYSFDMTFNGTEVEYVDDASKPVFTPAIVWNLTRNGTNLKGSALTGTPSIDGNVMTVSSSAQGNGLVAIKDEDGNIVWSWHIWVVNPGDHPVTDIKYVVGTDEFYMMSHTLGGIYDSVSPTGPQYAYNTYGMFYQWGRKEPLPAYGTETYANGVIALFDSEITKNESNDNYSTIVNALRNPLKLLRRQQTDRNSTVYYQQKANNMLWGAPATYTLADDVAQIPVKGEGFVKTVYDPCPEGYMVPQAYHFSGLQTSTANPARSGYGARLVYDGTNEAYYPLPGVFLNTQEIVSGTTKTTANGSSARFHCANPLGVNGWASTFFRVSFATKISFDFYREGQANACSVRCMKIPSNE